MQEHEQREHDRIPPELDPDFERYDDGKPPRTMRRRMQPFIWLVGAVTLLAMVLLVTQGL
ncbi:DUF3040 domain-containing protein [Agrococcus sp. ARC_14]|uniref:DUF3040 domain-containing protein n=1 Tax=Agrococcus sp. ARC_14 TaxID=2919927 RepID=UPI001F056971|nr:DUF3040 domain-containing protein [Agrococcus sp. ARC_14]MCH1884258.1 DUF3040 domain-containing protein [Agrococcus sp. ARC_14]